MLSSNRFDLIRPSSVLAVAFSLFVAGIGCEGAGNTAANIVLPPEKEEQLGDKVERQYLDSDVSVYRGEMVENYVSNLGSEAVQAAGQDSPEPIDYEFKVIDDPETVNAFAMPGGQIFFYTGLLKLADTQAEVMAVMSHEVAHVSKRHIAKRLVLVYGLQTVTQAAVGENPGLIGQLVGTILSQGALLSFSRKQERESDEVGFDYMVEAGYNPQGFVTFFNKLDERRGAEVPVWLSSHPLPEDRVEAAQKRMEGNSYEDKTVGEETHREIVRAIEGQNGRGGDLPNTGETGTSSGSDSGP